LGDYGRPLRFGLFLEPYADSPLITLARTADTLGLDLIGVTDHPYQRRYLETWTALSVLAANTTQIRLFPNVACLPLRPPAMLAKAAASLDRLSGGRIEVGLGAGAFWDPIVAYGGPRRSPGAALEALEEAVRILRLMWDGERGARFEGTHYQVAGARPGPLPAHRMEIWLGAMGPRALALTGRLGDGWSGSTMFLPPSRLPDIQTRIDAAAVAAGRTPESIRRVYTVGGVITPGPSRGFLDGPTAHWADELTTLALEDGIDTFLLAGDAATLDETMIHRFAEQVIPAVRDRVARARTPAG
jgi:alkanesulfonate monooxygenase SsuD/methylene tetrahydromethanopterin reductase-like flavin-dependent oxidoreductase (luciferase family)